ncbi:DUF2971 domain-containing protein [Vibrio tubiashii]|uniref:DUF2971 domain-containing protein n=1 Tax=Vibrio tubiashii TaxID=29498 RepID=UPI00349EE8E3
MDLAERERRLKELGIEHCEITDPEFLDKLAESELDVVLSIVRRSKIISLSASDDERDPITENLMWSHYADGLRGFCLVFDCQALQKDIHSFSNRAIRPIRVSYQDTPNELDINDFIQSPAMLNVSKLNYVDYVVKTIASKSKSWTYENEFRIISMSETNLHSYDPSTLNEIIIGDKMPLDQQKLVTDIVKSVNSSIRLKRAKLKENSYLIEIVDY